LHTSLVGGVLAAVVLLALDRLIRPSRALPRLRRLVEGSPAAGAAR
jgi:hypothetical protein